MAKKPARAKTKVTANAVDPNWVDPWSDKKKDGPEIETASSNPSLSPVSNRQMIEVMVGPAKGPKTRAYCRPDERICLPIKR